MSPVNHKSSKIHSLDRRFPKGLIRVSGRTFPVENDTVGVYFFYVVEHLSDCLIFRLGLESVVDIKYGVTRARVYDHLAALFGFLLDRGEEGIVGMA